MSTPNSETSAHSKGLYAYSGGAAIAAAVVFAIICTIVVVLRFITQIFIQRVKLGKEDWILIPGWVFLMGFCANTILSGVGRHEAYVLKFEPQVLRIWAQFLFTTELFYGVTIALMKTSILFFYLRLFSINRWFRVATYICIAYVWAWAFSETIAAIFQCSPVAYQWDKSLQGVCLDQLVFFRWVSVPNVIHDVAMIILPLPVVWRLQIGTQKKTALSAVFLVGALGCIASFVRLSFFWKTDAFNDGTWVSVQLMAWTIAEPSTICICACAPALWPLVARFIPGIRGTRRGDYAAGRDAGIRSLKREDNSHANFVNGKFIPLKDAHRVDSTEI